MKFAITGAVICTVVAAAAVANAHEPESLVASSFDVRSGGEEQSFAAGVQRLAEQGDESAWRSRIDYDEGWRYIGHHHRERGECEDWHECRSTSPVPEPSTWRLFALGAVLLGFARWRATRCT